MDYNLLLSQVEAYVIHFFDSNANENILYHDLVHTQDVVNHTAELAGYYKLTERDMFIVKTAAWFHDAGYYTGDAMGHEMRSAELAVTFLQSKNVDDETITAIQNCILATRMPQTPATLLEEIVCDADLAHLASEDFSPRNKLLRKETALTTGTKISKNDWRVSTLAFLQGYHFHTGYGKTVLEQGKQKNIDKLQLKITEGNDIEVPISNKDARITLPPVNTAATIENADEQKAAKKKKKEEDKPSRGIETMFRISSNNHQRLSDMADNKAHIMITTTSIIISVLLSVLLRKLEDNRYLTVPVILLLTVCVVTMVFCILATRPSIPHGTFTQQDVDEKKVNLLFFGNFYRMSLEDYAGGMQKMMEDREFLYGSLTKDVYAQGVVLGKKYNLLRVGYNVFMFGIVASVIAFVIATMFFSFNH